MGVKLEYKEALRQLEREKKKSFRRLTSVCRQELKRGGRRLERGMAREMRARTGIRLNQKSIREKYISTRFRNAKDFNLMVFTVTAKRKGIGLIHFVRGKLKQTDGPLKKRKSPYVAVYKGKKARVSRGFVLKLKKPGRGDPYRMFVRGSSGYRLATAPSIITLLNNSGFHLDEKGQRERARILVKVLRRKGWIFEPLD